MKKSELKEVLLKDYLYEEYIKKKYESILDTNLSPKTKTALNSILTETKGHAAMLQSLMRELNIDFDTESARSTSWLLQTLIMKKDSHKTLRQFLKEALVEEADVRKVYETQLKKINNKLVRDVLKKIIKEEQVHEDKVRKLLKKAG